MYRYGTRKGNLNFFENIKIKLGLADLYEVKEQNNILFKKDKLWHKWYNQK